MVASLRKATLHDVAKRAHVSVASVSNYLNDYPYMKPATRERIQQAIDELGYVTNQQARNLRSGRTGLISLSLPDLNQIYFSELAEEMITRAREYGYRIIIESTGNDRQREIESAHAMASNMTDGLILSPTAMRAEDVAELEGDYPLVVLGERIFNAPAPHVVMPNELGAQAATTHLLEAGCRTVAVVGGTLDESVPSSRSMRTKGYLSAFAERGVTPDLNLIRECGVLNQLSETAQNAFANIITILLGLTVAAKMHYQDFVSWQTLMILGLGLVAFIFDTVGGVVFAKFINLFLPKEKKINPMIGAAGISAFPMSGRVVNQMGLKEDPQNFLLMYSISVNVSGQIASVIAGGLILTLVS